MLHRNQSVAERRLLLYAVNDSMLFVIEVPSIGILQELFVLHNRICLLDGKKPKLPGAFTAIASACR